MSGVQSLLGKIIDAPQQRDAIHIAVAPVVAGEWLKPGQHVGLGDTGRAVAHSQPIGIVDPFLKEEISRGQEFWLFLYPGTATVLRHSWIHPAFKVVTPDPASSGGADERWLRHFAEQHDVTYEGLVTATKKFLSSGEYFYHPDDAGAFEGEWVPDEFWPHFEAATGERVPENKRKSFFSCSC